MHPWQIAAAAAGSMATSQHLLENIDGVSKPAGTGPSAPFKCAAF